MNAENSKKLFDRFEFFHPTPWNQGLMGFGFECGDGWFDLIWKLAEDLERIYKEARLVIIPENPFRVVQVKEKFGTLRFYINFGSDAMHDRIEQAEEESGRTCEVCGKPGELRGGFWVRTLCGDCDSKRA